MIRDLLIPALKREFADWEIDYNTPPQPIATFPAAQPDVGRVLIYDDGDEATVLIENITHGHFNPYNEKLSNPPCPSRHFITSSVIAVDAPAAASLNLDH